MATSLSPLLARKLRRDLRAAGLDPPEDDWPIRLARADHLQVALTSLWGSEGIVGSRRRLAMESSEGAPQGQATLPHPRDAGGRNASAECCQRRGVS